MKKKLLFLVIGLQTLFLLFLIVREERVIRHGPTIILETAPVDPRDLLRGDYVILSYKISRIPQNLIVDTPSKEECLDIKSGYPPLYVLLEPRGDYYEVAYASYKKISAARGQVLLAGKDKSPCYTSEHFIDYGLERFYVPEGTGLIPRDKKITVQVAVDSSGRGVVKELFVDKKPFNQYVQEQKTNR